MRKEEEFGQSCRLVLDFRKLNAVTQPMYFPTVVLEDILNQMANAKVFTTFDVKSASFHVPLHEKSRPYTAFSFGYNKYRFRSTAFGLVGSGYYWQLAVAIILKNQLMKNTMAYVDDIIIFSEDDTSKIKHTRAPLQITSVANHSFERVYIDIYSPIPSYSGQNSCGGPIVCK